MASRTCHWRGCRTRIEVDTAIEERNSMFVVAGWCEVHHEAFKIYTELEKKFAKDHNVDWPIGSLSYKKYKKALSQLHDLAGHRAEEAAKHGHN